MSMGRFSFSMLIFLVGCPKHKEDDTGPADTGGTGNLQISFEAVPGNGFDVGGTVYDTSAATYADKAAFTQDVLNDIVPNVIGAVGYTEAVQQQLTPGGFQLVTSPSLQIRSDMGQEVAMEVAAALGWTAYQWSVLVTDFGDTDGGTGYATVTFSGAPLSPEAAQAFFEHAAEVDPGLAGGYTAFGNDMIFLNLRDSDGNTYSGLEDSAFVADLTTAADGYMGADTAVSASGEAKAFLVENDWTGAAPTGEDYLELIHDTSEERLAELRAQYLTILESAATTYGW